MKSQFTELAGNELAAVEGGSFAYDVGRAVRFLGIGARSAFTNPSAAVIDWYGISLI